MTSTTAFVVRHRAVLFAPVLLAVLFAAAVAAQADVAGEWAVTFATPSGPAEFTMYVNQEGGRLTGRLTSEAGEFPLRGTVDGDNVTITWQLPDAGRIIDVTFTAKAQGDQMTGSAKLGTRGQGEFSAQRTGK